MDFALIIAGLAIALLAILGKAILAILQLQRKKRLRKIADDLGLIFIEDGNHALFSSISDFQLFSVGRKGKCSKMICGETDELTIGIFDYTYVAGSGESTKRYAQSVIALSSEQIAIPQFNLRPQRILDKLISVLGIKDIEFENYPEFSRIFFVQSNDEQGVRDFFDSEWIDFLTRFKGFSIQGRDGALIFYKSNKKVHPNQIKEYLSKAYDFFGHIVQRSGA